MGKNKYEVIIRRRVYQYALIEVVANDRKEAKRLALKQPAEWLLGTDFTKPAFDSFLGEFNLDG